MKKATLNRFISIVLTALMVITMGGGAVIGASAEIAVSPDTPANVYFYVPEAIYLAPSLNSATTLTAFQYYLNSYSSSSATTLGTYSTTGTVYFSCSNAVKGTLSYSCSADASISVGKTTVSGSTLSTTMSGSACNVNGSVITWIYTYVDSNGNTNSVTSYTYIYKPNVVPGGASAAAESDPSTFYDSCWSGSIFCLWGASYNNGGGSGVAESTIYMTGSGMHSTGNTRPHNTDMINKGTGTFSINDSAGDDETATSPGSGIYVDASRFTNLSNIPNLCMGFTMTDDESVSSSDAYIYVNGTTVFSQGNINTETCFFTFASRKGISYGTTGIVAGSSANVQLKSYIYGSGNSNCGDARTYCIINLAVYNTNKSALRSAYLAELKAAGAKQRGVYTTDSYNTYFAALKNAATVLGNPASPYSSVLSAVTTLSEAKTALTVADRTANVRHVALIPNGSNYMVEAIYTTAVVSETLDFSAQQAVTLSANSYTGYTAYGYKANQSDALGTEIALSSVTAGTSKYIKVADSNPTYTFYYIINTHNVNYYIDGDLYAADSFFYNYPMSYRDDVSKEGYTFSGWSFSSEPANMPDADITVNGSYSVNSYTLSYFVNGVLDGSVETYDFSAPITPRADKVKTGYTFSGWSDIPAKMPSENTVINATLLPNHYTVKYDVNCGTGAYSGTTADVEYAYDEYKGISACGYTRDNYSFSGWNTKSDGKGITYRPGMNVGNLTAVDGAEVILYAMWTLLPGSYEMIYYIDATEFARVSYDEGEAVTSLAPPEKYGHHFSGWDNEPTVMPAKNLVINATLIPNAHKVYYYVDGSLYKTVNASYLDTLSPIADAAKTGYTFSGWSAIPATMPDTDVDVFGTFEINYYDVIFYVDGEFYTSYEDVAYGTALSAPAISEREGYTFSGWTELPATVPAENISLYATFDVIKYNIEYYVDGELYKTDRYPYDEEIVKLGDITKEGYTFSGWTWSEDVTNMPAYTLTATGFFTPNASNIIFDANGGTGTMANLSMTYDVQLKLTANAFSRENYVFACWNSKADGTGNMYLDTQNVMNIASAPGANITLYAQWQVKDFDTQISSEIPDGYAGIHTVEGLQSIISHNLGGKFILMASLDLAGYDWQPIGSESAPFSGVLLGNGHTISNLTVSVNNNGGLFTAADGAVIKDIRFNGVSISAADEGSFAGTIAGRAKNTIVANCVIESGRIAANGFAGGFFGELNGGGISRSYSNAEVLVPGGIAGGLVGSASGAAALTNVYNTGAVEAEKAGGLVGKANTLSIKCAYAACSLKADVPGGAIGECESASLTNVYTWAVMSPKLCGTGSATGVNAAVYTEPELKTQGALKGFDFDGIWKIDGSFPMLGITEKLYPSTPSSNADLIDPESPTWLQVFLGFFRKFFTKISEFFRNLSIN